MSEDTHLPFLSTWDEDDDRETATDLAVDADGIPILDQVISSPSTRTPAPASRSGLNLPNHLVLLSAMREQLRQQLQKDMERLITDVVSATVARSVREYEQHLHSALERALTERMEDLVEQVLDEGLSPDEH